MTMDYAPNSGSSFNAGNVSESPGLKRVSDATDDSNKCPKTDGTLGKPLADTLICYFNN